MNSLETQSAKGKLTLVKRASETSAQEAQWKYEDSLSEFAGTVQLARNIRRKYPELFEAAELPESFVAALRAAGNYEPDFAEPFVIGGEKELLERGVLKARQPETAA